MAEKTEQNIIKKKHRSPNYPVISLPKALDRVRDVYREYARHEVSIRILNELWGYKPMTNVLLQTVAALRSYGLIDVAGEGENRKIRISSKAYRILENAPDRQQLIQESSLEPKIYSEIWEKYKDNNGLPNDKVLKHDLMWGDDFQFNKNAVDSFIADFRETIEFAQLNPTDINDIIEESKLGEKEMLNETNFFQVGKEKEKLNTLNIKSFQLPLIGAVATLSIPHPMSEKNFNILKKMLDAMKDALVADSTSDSMPETS